MNYYFKKFAIQEIQSASDDYIWLLYLIYCSLIEAKKNDEHFWDNLKNRINEFNFERRTIDRIKKCSPYVLHNSTINSSRYKEINDKSKLKSLQVKNFRGFGSEFNGEDNGVLIEFDSNNTIFYGPNGSGKSSLSDALEYKLTGEVREATRRNRKVTEYVKRIGSNSHPQIRLKFENPSINCENLSEEEKKYYQQSFIEKNRIQEFCLFGSKDTGIRKEHILSILIGMDELSDLAKEFVQPISFKSNLISFKRNLVSNKIQQLEMDNLSNISLQKNHSNIIEAEKVKANILLSKTDTTIADLEIEIKRIDADIAIINADSLSLSLNTVFPQTKADFEDIIQLIKKNLTEHDELKLVLEEAKIELSFSNLYTVIEELSSVITDTCPACDTPLANVTQNPIIKAKIELSKLKELKEKENNFNIKQRELEENLKQIYTLQNNLYLNSENFSILQSHIQNLTFLCKKPNLYSLSDREVLNNNIKSIMDELPKLTDYFTELDSIHQKQTHKQKTINYNNNEISELNDRKNKVTLIKNTWESFQKKLVLVNDSLGAYAGELMNLNIEKNAEDNYNNFIDSLIYTYVTFYNKFQKFKDLEFKTKFGKIETEIAGFYTQINRHDSVHDKVDFFKISNVESDYKIEFQLNGLNTLEDASIKFSEGHLRALGLSILLANAKNNELPFIIFDDVVNAIDSDHRANIIEMMVNDTYLKNVQQIVSTHDRLYWERFSIENPKGMFRSYILKCTEDGIVHYHYNLSFKEKIQSALDNFDIRQALLYCRIWFETIAKQYCMENNIKLQGTLKQKDFHVSIEPSLGSIYCALYEKLRDNENLKLLHQDEINYKGINQEHHSFDEFNFNFIHSRTSQEIKKIFDAVSGLDNDIKFLKNYNSVLEELIESYWHCYRKIRNLNDKMTVEFRENVIKKYQNICTELIDVPKKMSTLNFDSKIIDLVIQKVQKVLINSIIQIISNHFNI